MTKPSRNPKRDVNHIAAELEGATRESPKKGKKNPAAVALGRLGGLKGGNARARTLSKSRRAEIAKRAAFARWSKLANE